MCNVLCEDRCVLFIVRCMRFDPCLHFLSYDVWRLLFVVWCCVLFVVCSVMVLAVLFFVVVCCLVLIV